MSKMKISNRDQLINLHEKLTAARLAVRAASDALEVLKPGKDSHYTRLQNQCDAFAALCANHLRLLIGISPDAPLE